MSISEAVQLVIQASSLSKGGEIFLLDMGEPIKIYDLALSMIYLSGLTLKNKNNDNGDIEILTSGLREGEKMFEELLIDSSASSTKHPLIFSANEKSYPKNDLLKKIDDITKFADEEQLEDSLKLLKELVPEWQSKKFYGYIK